MQEALLQYIWKHSLFTTKIYKADTGESVIIENTGSYNTDGGPDFSNARILIDNTLWAGNIEIHLKTSDWSKHGHQRNAAYNNVILHVSNLIDSECKTANDRRVPCIELKYDNTIEDKYSALLKEDKIISCYKSLPKLDTSLISFWLSALSVERLLEKTAIIKELLDFTKNHWEEAFYIHLAKSFGLKVNSVPMELLAKSTPLKILARHSSNLFQLEALIFGQAGFLTENASDEYQASLKKEYEYLSNKYQLKKIDQHLWQFLRLRPANFPTVRLAEFCSLINKSKGLLSLTFDCESLKDLQKLFRSEPGEYWKTHYVFGKATKFSKKSLGLRSINSFIINTVLPFMFTYARLKNIDDLQEKSLAFLEQIPPEENHIIEEWKNVGIHSKSAVESQAILQLTTKYCKSKRCLDCQIGTLILR